MSVSYTHLISSTAYSSDPNKSYFSFLPISAHRLFFWKTIQGFLWGELTVLLFGVGVILFRNIPILDACLLLGYGTATNYSCVWIGVFLDYKMPRTPNSTNELLHGNISKVLVLFVSIALTAVSYTHLGAEDCLEEQEEADTSLSGKEDARTSIMEKLAQFKEQSSQMGIGNNKNREKAASL